MGLVRPALVAAAALTAFSPAVARADFFAAVNTAAPAPRTDLDVAVVNVSTGAKIALPVGVNTAATESHPDITPDGSA